MHQYFRLHRDPDSIGIVLGIVTGAYVFSLGSVGAVCSTT